MKQAIVTGALGFVGRNLVQELVAQDYHVFAIDREIPDPGKPGSDDRLTTWIRCDLADTTGLPQLIRQRDIDVLFHLAWDGVRPELRNDLDRQIGNIGSSLQLLRAAKAMGVRRAVLLGSTMEYIYYGKPIDAYALPTPQNAYGSAKLAARYLCEQLARELEIEFIYGVATSIYGVGREDSNVIYYTMKKLLDGEKPSLTRLEQKWDFIHIRDLARALRLIGDRGTPGGFYAIGRGDNQPLSHYIEIIHALAGPSLPLGIGEVPYSGSRLPMSCIDPHDLTRDTGFTAEVDFRTGIGEVIRHYQASRSANRS